MGSVTNCIGFIMLYKCTVGGTSVFKNGIIDLKIDNENQNKSFQLNIEWGFVMPN